MAAFITAVEKFGYNGDIDSADNPQDVWIYGPTVNDIPFPEAAAVTTVLSSEAGDTSDGSGARSVTIEGLDSNYYEQSETIDLAGSAAATAVSQYIRVHRAYVATAGSATLNEGNIDVKHSSTVLARIGIVNGEGLGQTLQCGYTVPADYWEGNLKGWVMSAGRGTWEIVGVIQVRPQVGAWRTLELHIFQPAGGMMIHEEPHHIVIPRLSDIRMRVLESTANNMSVSAAFDLDLMGND